MTKRMDPYQGAPGIAGRNRPRQQRSPAEEEAFQEAVKRPGFWESLTPEARAMLESMDLPQYLVGRPPEIRDIPRRPRRRGEPPREG